MRKGRKGQAALEFLTTYGWAFLVILIMIGALAYFGVLNPKNFLPSRCTFSPEVDCLESRIVADSGSGDPMVSFRFRNNVGATALFNASAVYIGGNNPETTCDGVDGTEQIPPGRVREVNCTFDSADTILPQGDKAKFEITMSYRKVDGSYWTPVKGEIYGTVD
ncbi:hypothetical protein JW826_00115 [Candidatus Woesearchaeota archaeon]|nr:hypothetical protein [Candidatus Woesearchaeota archaeon]